MIEHMKAHLLLNICFQIIEQIIFKLRHRAAGGTNQMMMMMLGRVSRIDLITAAAITKFHLLQKFQFRQQFQAAVNGSQTNFRLALPQNAMHILSRKMLTGMVEKNLQHRLALGSHLVLPCLQALPQIVHCKCLCHKTNPFYIRIVRFLRLITHILTRLIK